MSIIILLLKSALIMFLGLYLFTKKERYTLIPLYVYLGILTIYLHTFSSAEHILRFGNFSLLLSSTVYSPSIIAIILVLYLLEGMTSLKASLYTFILISFFHILTLYINEVYLVNSATHFNVTELKYYFWSVLSFVIDVFAIVIIWESLQRIFEKKYVLKIFLTMLLVFYIDTFVFVSGVFSNSEFYSSILISDLANRSLVSILISIILSIFLFSKDIKSDQIKSLGSFKDLISLRGISERKILDLQLDLESNNKLKDSLQKANEKLELSLSAIDAGVLIWNIERKIMSVNEKFYELTDKNKDNEVYDLDSIKNYIYEDDRFVFQQAVETTIKKSMCEKTYLRLKRKNQDGYWVSMSGKAQLDKNGNPSMLVICLIDVDEQKRAEIDLQRINKAMVSHELELAKLKLK